MGRLPPGYTTPRAPSPGPSPACPTFTLPQVTRVIRVKWQCSHHCGESLMSGDDRRGKQLRGGTSRSPHDPVAHPFPPCSSTAVSPPLTCLPLASVLPPPLLCSCVPPPKPLSAPSPYLSLGIIALPSPAAAWSCPPQAPCTPSSFCPAPLTPRNQRSWDRSQPTLRFCLVLKGFISTLC